MKHFIFEEDAKKRIKKQQIELIIVDIIFVPMFVVMGMNSSGGIGMYISIFLLFLLIIGSIYYGYYTINALNNIHSEEKWFVEINDKEVIWEAPQSLHLETSFTVLLSDISHVIEEVHHSSAEDESYHYKIALHNSEKIPLSQYSGIPIERFIEALKMLKIPCETIKI